MRIYDLSLILYDPGKRLEYLKTTFLELGLKRIVRLPSINEIDLFLMNSIGDKRWLIASFGNVPSSISDKLSELSFRKPDQLAYMSLSFEDMSVNQLSMLADRIEARFNPIRRSQFETAWASLSTNIKIAILSVFGTIGLTITAYATELVVDYLLRPAPKIELETGQTYISSKEIDK